MLRFILTRETYDGIKFHDSNLETLDVNVPELETMLRRGGYGAGPNGDSFDKTDVIGVELREPPAKETK